MEIQLKITGGIVGKIEDYPTINTNKLPSNIKNHILDIIEKIRFFVLPEKLYTDKGYDFIYTTLTIDGHKVTDIDVSSNPTVDQKNFKILVKHIKGIYEIFDLKPKTNRNNL